MSPPPPAQWAPMASFIFENLAINIIQHRLCIKHDLDYEVLTSIDTSAEPIRIFVFSAWTLTTERATHLRYNSRDESFCEVQCIENREDVEFAKYTQLCFWFQICTNTKSYAMHRKSVRCWNCKIDPNVVWVACTAIQQSALKCQLWNSCESETIGILSNSEMLLVVVVFINLSIKTMRLSKMSGMREYAWAVIAETSFVKYSYFVLSCIKLHKIVLNRNQLQVAWSLLSIGNPEWLLWHFGIAWKVKNWHTWRSPVAHFAFN